MTGKHRLQILRTVVIAAAVAALTILVAIAATAGRGAADPPRLALLQDRHEAPPPAELQQMIMQKGAPAPGCLVPPHTPANPDPRLYGAWSTVLPAEGGGAIRQILGMQTVHTLMLPSGKILLASGSSWRNLAPIQYYPHDSDPVAPKGIFNRDKDPFRKSKLRWYYQLVNNAAIYDPEHNTFYRIPHPVPVDDPDNPGHFAPNDLFCTGQQHLPDGNVLVTGGTQYYYPFRTGNRSTYIFDWKKEMGIHWSTVDWRQLPTPAHDPWIFSGFMKRGRWYPSLVPLLDGRLAIWSGFVGFDKGYPEMYQFEINHYVELFNPAAFDRRDPQSAWRAVDVKELRDSPYRTEINPDFRPTPGSVCPARCIEDNRFDAFKLYPENYLMPDGRIYLTREGDWVSLRTCDTAFMRRTKHTYWATLGGTDAAPTVEFSRGPDRPEDITSYGTSLLDPNSGNIEILGGQPTSPGTLLPVNSDQTTHFAGGRGSRKIETFHADAGEKLGGHWTLDENFLGDAPQDDRTMHYALILPTRQVLIINGGNYDFYGPVFYPLLLTPKFDGDRRFIGYEKVRMSEGVEPRLYHNAALLLPDGRIWVSGGNTARATVHDEPAPKASPAAKRSMQPLPNLNAVDVDMYFFNDGPMARGQKGMLTTPTEDWVAETFSPPYLFIDPGRRAAVVKISAPSREIGGKTFYLLHSNEKYDMLLGGLPASCAAGGEASLALIKLPSATHGWENGQRFVALQFEAAPSHPEEVRLHTPDARHANIPPGYYMLFYVDCMGKPSVARMVRFDDQAREP
jgi:hypothetical protein